MRIYLTGFMGAGKTSVGLALAERLDLPFIDLDRVIEHQAGCSVRAIFERHGEAHFRDLEHRALAATAAHDAAVIATGGGLVTRRRNLELLERLGKTVWLDTPFELIVERMRGAEKDQRPLFQDPDQARRLYRERLQAYRNCDLRIGVEAGETATELAVTIASLL